MDRKFIFFKDSQYLDEFNKFSDKLIYTQQNFEKFSRLVIWPNNRAIEVLKHLLKSTKERFGILYVLRASRCNNDEARYKMENLDLNQVTDFLNEFCTFIEYDSRHRIVIRSLDEKRTYFVYDEENLLVAYGDVEQYKNILHLLGFEEYFEKIVYPDPHMHSYHKELDKYEDKVLSYFPWIKSELMEVDR
ncbi:hypothetical protein [Paenibacillus sp. P46E]|uniref:hypothetical protein n=1 Tax=Paenibacillus sp. P46E TaxID=1349436 RepID=UPI00093903B9|nr:hypothetical protein [Paenibacillus sp. P46E]OKP94388.1 hypothetical protein A3849_29275 [Paenibacillus sp. P46E]